MGQSAPFSFISHHTIGPLLPSSSLSKILIHASPRTLKSHLYLLSDQSEDNIPGIQYGTCHRLVIRLADRGEQNRFAKHKLM
ncbi:hypothetical protein R6Q59_018692 [Mikania micrantha]